jgi:hypothetical protein
LSKDWGSFGATVGTTSGALVGLLFVAVSLNIAHIAAHPALRVAAAKTLVLFMTPLVASILLVTPGQSDWELGVELIAAGLFAGVTLIRIGRAKHKAPKDESRLARALDRTAPNLLTCGLIEVAGVTVIAGGGGLYWLVPAMIVALISGVVNAWLLLVRLPGS